MPCIWKNSEVGQRYSWNIVNHSIQRCSSWTVPPRWLNLSSECSKEFEYGSNDLWDLVILEKNVDKYSSIESTLVHLKTYNSKYMYVEFTQRARTTNGKIGPVDLPKNKNGWVCLKDYWLIKWIHADFKFVVIAWFSNWFLSNDVIKVSSSPKYHFCVETSKISTLFCIIHIRTNLRWILVSTHI